MNTNSTITVTGLDLMARATADDARAARDLILKSVSMSAQMVTSVEDAARAAELLKEIKGFTRSIEAERSRVKGPVIELGKKIDALASELTAELETRATDISRKIGAFQAEQNRLAEIAREKALAEERRLREEAERVEREAQEKVRREAEAAAAKARKEAEEIAAKAAKAARARSEAGRAKAEQEAAAAASRAKAEAQEAEKRAADEAQKRREQLAAQVVADREKADAVAVRPTGTVTREETKFEVMDVMALYQYNALLVTITPNETAIRGVLKANPKIIMPGVRFWKETKTFVR